MLKWMLAPILMSFAACGPESAPPVVPVEEAQTPAAPRLYTAQVIRAFPHRTDAYTQGLFFADGDLYETTGKRGGSTLARLDTDIGRVLAEIALPEHVFGEGAVALHGKIYSLTWKSKLGFIHDAQTLQRVGTFDYTGEGWGLTSDDTSLILSDGTAILRYLDPEDFTQTRRLTVRLNGQPLKNLNELEWVSGEIWANIWQSDTIARIDPATGTVTGLIDVSALFPVAQRNDRLDDVPNGIAYDSANDRLILTGKRWPQMFEVEVVAGE